MTNFEKLKSMSKEDLANFLYYFDFEVAGSAFGKAFCDKCIPEIVTDENGHTHEVNVCEFDGIPCRFVADETITAAEYDNPVLWWLNQEAEEDK